MNDERLAELISIIKEDQSLSTLTELLQCIQLYTNESGNNKSDVSNLISQVIEDLN